MRKFKKPLFIFSGILLFIAIAGILFISPLTKYLIQKYDEKYTGRQITMDWVYVNPFTGYIHFSNLKIYELKSDSVFFSVSGLTANMGMFKLFSKTYELSEFTLNHPRGIIIQNKKDFNFDDLLLKFKSKENADTVKATTHFNILNIKINGGEFYYQEKQIPINYSIKSVQIESSGMQWDKDTIALRFSLLPGTGSGDMNGDITFNIKNKDYSFATIVHKFNLKIIEQYLKDLSNYGSFSANIDADIKAKGNLNNQENITATGSLAINDFHFGKDPEDDYASFNKLGLSIIELSPMNHKYLFDSVSLSHPYFKYERYDYLDNMQTMFGKGGSNVAAVKADADKFNLVIEIARYVKILARNFFQSYYKINRLAIYKGDLKYNDYSLSEKFSMSLNPLYIIADSIDKNHQRVNVSFKSGMLPYGDAAVSVSINPKDSSDFDLQYHVQKVPVSLFNPYTISYTSFPLDRGTLDLKGKWTVRNGNIQSENHLVIIDPRVTKKLRNKDNRWIPLPLIMSFIRERGNVIDYEIPITGNLKDPKFHFHDVLFDLLGNIFVKPATTPYRTEVKNIETEIEKSLTIKWEMRHNTLTSNQEKFVKRMADFLTKTPKASITIYPQLYTLKEKEYILFFEAKKKYFLSTENKDAQSFTESDSEKVDKMSVKDSSFIHYLNKKIKGTPLFTIQEKCSSIINSDIVNKRFRQLNRERADAFNFYFKEKKVENRVTFSNDENVIPYNGFSFYKIEYKGEYPESLLKAYQELNELNNETPRKQFEKERKINSKGI